MNSEVRIFDPTFIHRPTPTDWRMMAEASHGGEMYVHVGSCTEALYLAYGDSMRGSFRSAIKLLPYGDYHMKFLPSLPRGYRNIWIFSRVNSKRRKQLNYDGLE